MKKFHFFSPGERSVGLFPASGTITIDSNIILDKDTETEIKQFFSELLEVTMQTQEEYEADLKKHDIYFCTVCHTNPVNVFDGIDTCPICQEKI
jgi:rubrerythrin